MRLLGSLWLAAFALAGCATPDADVVARDEAAAAYRARQAEFNAYADQILSERDAGRLPFADAARMQLRKAEELGVDDERFREVVLYAIAIGAKVDAGEMTPDEYRYHLTAKRNEVEARWQQTRAQAAAAAAALYEIERPRPIGGTSCYRTVTGTHCASY